MKTGLNFSTRDSNKNLIRRLHIDLDGVIYNDNTIISGEVDVINKVIGKNL